jgi:hypothetical protein
MREMTSARLRALKRRPAQDECWKDFCEGRAFDLDVARN